MSGPVLVENIPNSARRSHEMPTLDQEPIKINKVTLEATQKANEPESFSSPPREVVSTLIEATEFKALPAGTQRSVEASFNRMDRSERHQFVGLLNSLPQGQARSDLIELLDRKVNGVPAILSKDSIGNTLLENLVDLKGASNMKEELKGYAGNITEQVIAASARLGEVINQGDKATCTAGSSQFALCNSQPSEFARLVAGISSESGRVQLASGEELKAGGGKYDSRGVNGMFQDSLMELGVRLDNHSSLKYDAETGMSVGTLGLPFANGETQKLELEYSGLFPHQYELMSEALFNKPMERLDTVTVGSEEVIERVKQQLARDPAGGVKADLKWQSGTSDECHAIQITEVKDGRVYYFNSQVGIERSGANFYDVPPRQAELENGRNIRIESMELDRFEGLLNCVLVEGGDYGSTPLLDEYRLDPDGLMSYPNGSLYYYYHLHEEHKRRYQGSAEQQQRIEPRLNADSSVMAEVVSKEEKQEKPASQPQFRPSNFLDL